MHTALIDYAQLVWKESAAGNGAPEKVERKSDEYVPMSEWLDDLDA